MNLQKNLIQAEAKRLGFSFIGFAEPRQTPHFSNFQEWIQEGKNAELEYLAKPYVIQGRRQPESLLIGARSVVVAGISYVPQIRLGDITSGNKSGYGWIAAYGCLADYHRTITDKFRSLIKFINEMVGQESKFKIFVDSGPVMEKDFAVQAGLGWIGKNSLLINPRFGSYCLLGCLFLDLEIPPDSPLEGDVCNDCKICINACPTQCINTNRTINTEQCISYQTVENKLDIPGSLAKKMGSWVFGCDICQMVCPVNRKLAEKAIDPSILQIPVISQKAEFSELEMINAEEFEQIFAGTPVLRTGSKIFQRNITNALNNQKEERSN